MESKNKFKQLLKLIQENPELPIVPMVHIDICDNDDYTYWMGGWGESRLDELLKHEERIYFQTDYDDLIEEVIENNFDEWINLSDEQQHELACDIVNGYEWKKCIVVRIELPD